MAKKLRADLLSGLYRPDYQPIVEPLNEVEFDPEAISKSLEEDLSKRIEGSSRLVSADNNSNFETNKKLTVSEAEALDDYIDSLSNELDYTRNRINNFKSYLDDQVRAAGSELSFTMNIKKKPMLRRAVINIFGKKAPAITYSMYLEARKAKKLIEEQQSEEYLSADWEE